MEQPDYAVLVPDQPVLFRQLKPEEAMHVAVRRHIPDLGTQGLGRLRLWFSDTFTRDMPDNRVAGLVIESFGYRLPGGWAGTVAISMDEDDQGTIPPLSWEMCEIIDEADGLPDFYLPFD